MTEKIKKIKQWLEKNDSRLAYITDPTNIFYLTGFKCNPHERFLGLFVFPEDEPFIVCPELEVGQARAAFAGKVIGYRDDQDPWAAVGKALDKKKQNGEKIAIEPSTLPYKNAVILSDLYESPAFISIEGLLSSMRSVKSRAELDAMKKAGEIADYAVQIGVNAIKKGRTERAIIAEIEYELAKHGYSEMAFDTMVLTGENSAAPHGYPGTRQIKEGDFVLFDLGVVVNGYCSDITRTVCYKHATDDQIKIYNTCLQANRAAIQVVRKGLRIGDLDGTARKVISEAGYGHYFTHRLGHGLGLGEHEAPSMSADNDKTLTTGMVFTIEPGIYVPDLGGVRIEDDIYLSEDGPVTLTHYSKDLQIIQ
ncbi:aminopeptidase P family protein [Sporolactobacillus sp. THM7-7]|nr:aminopeptidase P family protein [Sporolactobacillus sp. THM7-7]